MKIRSLALALALGFALTATAEAKKRPVYSHKAQKARKANIARYKATKQATKHKISKVQVKRAKRK
jgi:hypothetical protein